MSNVKSEIIGRPVYIVDGARTPFLKSVGKPGPFKALDLSIFASRFLLLKNSINSEAIDELIVGCVTPEADECNIARLLALRLGLSQKTPAHTVQRNCASGMQSVDTGFRNIAHGYSDLILAGGVEAMSHAPLILNQNMAEWLSDWASSKSVIKKVKTLLQLKPEFLVPIIGLLKGLQDPTLNLTMGQTAENLAYKFGIPRKEMDEYALNSHHRLYNAQQNDVFAKEIVTIYDNYGTVYDNDNGVRGKNTLKALGKLRPAFDRVFGNITAGNSAQITDGASFVLLASEDALTKHNLTPLAKIIDTNWAGVNPAIMGIGPAHAIAPLIERNNLKCADIDYWELNEAFAAQVIACIKALADVEYCIDEIGLTKMFGGIPLDKINIHGGGISLGHPVGASGTRIIHHLALVLEKHKAKHGVASLCIGHGQGGAMLLENTTL